MALVGCVVVGLSALGWWASRPAPEQASAVSALDTPPGAASEAAGAGSATRPRVTGTLPPLAAAGAAPEQAPMSAPVSAFGRAELEAEVDAGDDPDAQGASSGDGDASRPKSLTTFEDVKSALAAAEPEITKCYEQALALKPKIRGRVVVAYVIAERDGKSYIREANIVEEGTDPEMLDPFFGMCVLKAVGDVQHGLPTDKTGAVGGEVRVRYPYTFAPDDEE